MHYDATLSTVEKLDSSDIEERSSEVNPEEKMEVSEEMNVEKVETVVKEVSKIPSCGVKIP